MNTSRDQITTTLDEAEDLTLFADETFDTDDVDLFEFTGEEDSPLTRLKSIILSLDWEITDEILLELAEELDELQKVWEGDKVARVYLQGLDKIGRYLRSQGAYAHPNAIKLLLTFYYNFEKIISSPDITGETIAALLKGDVRKFKILQYQISQTVPPPEIDEQGETKIEIALPVDSDNPLQLLKASILGLEWEVTDEGLREFDQRLTGVEESCGDDKSARVLIQGLKALGAYITDEKADAHPEAFTLLHSFYEGLEALLGNEELDDTQRQDLLIDRVGRLNALKATIARAAASASTADEVIDEILQPDENGTAVSALESDDEGPSLELSEEPELPDAIGSDTGAVTAMETAETPYPEDVLDPSAIQPVTDEIADDFIEEELSIGTEITPALAGSDEEIGFDEALAVASLDGAPMEEIEEQLDLLFPDSELEENEAAAATETAAAESGLSFTDDEMFAGLDDILTEDTEGPEEEAAAAPTDAGGEEPPPALADADEEGGFSEDATVADLDASPVEELEEKLDFFFGESEAPGDAGMEITGDEEPSPALAEDAPAEPEEALPAEEESAEIAPALADAPDEGGFNEDLVAETIDDGASLDIDRKLDSFFGESEDEVSLEEDGTELTDSLEGTKATEETIAPALADTDEEGGFSEDATVADLDASPVEELEEKLDFFFGESEAPGDAGMEITGDEEPSSALAEDAPEEAEEALPVEEESAEIAPALADAPDEGGFDEELVAETIDDGASLDIDRRLDSFFGEGDEASGEEVSGLLPDEAPQQVEEAVEDIAPALADAADETGFDEEQEAGEIVDKAAMNIEARLDAFFGASGADQRPLPDFGAPGEMAAAEKEIPASMNTKAGTSLREQQGAGAGTAMAALAETIGRLAGTPTAEAVAEITARIEALDRQSMAPAQVVQLQLLDSAIDMLSRLQQPPGEDSLHILDYLARGVEQGGEESARLVESVARFTAWQRQIMAEILERQPAAEREKQPELAMVSEEIRSAFTELRSSLAEELESLRRELRQQ